MPQLATRLTSDTLFVGATRPPMRWGVTYAALIFNLIFTLELFLATRNLLALALALPIHGLEPDPQGKLAITLMPVRNYASLNALEVVDESK